MAMLGAHIVLGEDDESDEEEETGVVEGGGAERSSSAGAVKVGTPSSSSSLPLFSLMGGNAVAGEDEEEDEEEEEEEDDGAPSGQAPLEADGSLRAQERTGSERGGGTRAISSEDVSKQMHVALEQQRMKRKALGLSSPSVPSHRSSPASHLAPKSDSLHSVALDSPAPGVSPPYTAVSGTPQTEEWGKDVEEDEDELDYLFHDTSTHMSFQSTPSGSDHVPPTYISERCRKLRQSNQEMRRASAVACAGTYKRIANELVRSEETVGKAVRSAGEALQHARHINGDLRAMADALMMLERFPLTLFAQQYR